MSILEYIFIGGVALMILSGLGSIYFFLQFSRRRILFRRRLKKTKGKKKKNTSLKRMKLEKKIKQSFYGALIFCFLTVLFAGVAMFVSYYQSMNLTAEDSEAVVKSYYLLRDLKEQLELADSQSEESFQENIRLLSTGLASYGIRKASDLNSTEGQIILNRYYNGLKQLGMNASTQVKYIYGNKELITVFLSDVQRVISYETAVFDYYQVNHAAFSEK